MWSTSIGFENLELHLQVITPNFPSSSFSPCDLNGIDSSYPYSSHNGHVTQAWPIGEQYLPSCSSWVHDLSQSIRVSPGSCLELCMSKGLSSLQEEESLEVSWDHLWAKSERTTLYRRNIAKRLKETVAGDLLWSSRPSHTWKYLCPELGSLASQEIPFPYQGQVRLAVTCHLCDYICGFGQ